MTEITQAFDHITIEPVVDRQFPMKLSFKSLITIARTNNFRYLTFIPFGVRTRAVMSHVPIERGRLTDVPVKVIAVCRVPLNMTYISFDTLDENICAIMEALNVL